MSAWPNGTRRAKLAAASGTVKRVHINRGIVAQNRRLGGTLPEITIQTSAGSIPCREVHILGPSRMVQGLKPLKCGARMDRNAGPGKVRVNAWDAGKSLDDCPVPGQAHVEGRRNLRTSLPQRVGQGLALT